MSTFSRAIAARRTDVTEAEWRINRPIYRFLCLLFAPSDLSRSLATLLIVSRTYRLSRIIPLSFVRRPVLVPNCRGCPTRRNLRTLGPLFTEREDLDSLRVAVRSPCGMRFFFLSCCKLHREFANLFSLVCCRTDSRACRSISRRFLLLLHPRAKFCVFRLKWISEIGAETAAPLFSI